MKFDNQSSNSTSKLGELLDLIIDYRGKTPKKLGGDFVDSGIPVISAIHIKRGKIIWEERERFVTDEMFHKWMKEPLRKDDLLLTSEAPLGEVALVPNNEKLVLSQRLFALRTKPNVLDARYLMYFFQSNLGQEELKARASGSTVVGIKQSELVNISIKCPPMNKQKVIGQVLSALDVKITLNEKLSKTLEDIAQTIFKSWFIDFDPVKAKMNGEKPIGMDDETTALFPDSFEESELGLIPKGWEVGSLGDLYDLQGGFAFKSSSWTETGVPVIKIGSVKPGLIDFEQVSFVSKEFANEIPDDYRLPAGSLVVGLTGYVGEVGLARNHFPVPLVNQRVAKFKSKSGDWKLPYIYCLTRNPKFKSTVEELSTGTAQQNVSNSQILSIPIVKPTKKVFTHFENMLESYFNQIINLADENETLKTLRDSLLPRLISGELQIPKDVGFLMSVLNEEDYELQCISWLNNIGWDYKFGPDIAFDGQSTERASHKDVVLVERLKDSILKINPGLPLDVVNKVVQKVISPGEVDVLKANTLIHKWLIEGIPEKVRDLKGEETTKLIWLIDYDNVENNDWLAVNQFSVQTDSDAGTRRPDIVLFLNGLPITVIELKNPADTEADIWQAFNQIQTYKEQISRLFFYNSTLVIADGADARAGSLTADKERFLKWRSTDGVNLDPYGMFGSTQTLIEGMFNKRHVLETINHFTVFVPEQKMVKMMPAYHHFFAVEKAYLRAIKASKENGDGRGGLMWHTQGSGKSYEMACLAGMLATSKELKNPTIVVVTDRKNLDHQLFDTFVSAKSLLKQDPEMANSREDLREKIGTRPSGGVIFTTIQKFAPEADEQKFPSLTNRRNVFVFTDEAHRSQYGFSARIDKDKFKVGYAQHLRDALPNATFVAFTGTPVAETDRDTRAVFGDEIDIYDMAQANADGATVPIYYESRLVELDLPEDAKKELNDLAENLIEDEEENIQANLKRQWAELEKIVGAKPRLERIAKDIVEHFENRCKAPELANGKAMIVGMSRNICADLYEEIIKLKPEWHDKDHRKGVIKVVFHSSASDDEKLRPHAYTEPQKRELENRFKDADDELKIVIVRDMWLTGYDSPPCHTMYVDKPMRGHNLMQAIARVNRVFKDKPGGLVVDYIGIGTELKEALASYTKGKAKTNPVEFIEEALGVFFEKLTIIKDMLHGCDISDFKNKPTSVAAEVANFVIGLEDGTKRFADASLALSKAYALVNSQPAAIEHREEVALYQAIRVLLTKGDHTAKKQSDAERDLLIKQALAKGIVPEGIIDIFTAAGLEKPNIGMLSDEFLREIQAMKQKNLAVEALRRLIKGEIKSKFKRNVVRNMQFSELLEAALNKYRNRSIETAQLIEELIELAKTINKQVQSGNTDGLTEEEVAFYDALEVNQAAVREMKHEDLVRLAQELTKKVKENIKVDWSVRESTQAALRVLVRDLLDKYGYPPDFSKQAIETVIKQAESLTEEWLEQKLDLINKSFKS